MDPAVEKKETRIEQLEQVVLKRAYVGARKRNVKINGFELNGVLCLTCQLLEDRLDPQLEPLFCCLMATCSEPTYQFTECIYRVLCAK